MHSVQIILVLVGLGGATVVAVFARHVAVPAPSLLVVAGLLLGFLPGVPDVHITPEIISLVVLPPLLYAAGEELSWPQLRRSWKPVAVLAIGLVPASAAAVAVMTVATPPVPWVLAFPGCGDRARPQTGVTATASDARSGGEPVQRCHEPHSFSH